jgi:hypothetical protein
MRKRYSQSPLQHVLAELSQRLLSRIGLRDFRQRRFFALADILPALASGF